MTAYIPRCRGEAKDVVAANRLAGEDALRSDTCRLCLFVFEGNGNEFGKRHEQDCERNGFAPKPHTPCFEIDCILSPLASLCVIDTFLKLINQILVVT